MEYTEVQITKAMKSVSETLIHSISQGESSIFQRKFPTKTWICHMWWRNGKINKKTKTGTQRNKMQGQKDKS